MQRISSNILPCVAPTTYMRFSVVPHSCDFFKTFSKRRSPCLSSVSWKSWLPLLLVNASRITHFPSYSRKGFTLSSPMYGATVTESRLNPSKNVWAYILDVLPISPRLASAMIKWFGWFSFIY